VRSKLVASLGSPADAWLGPRKSRRTRQAFHDLSARDEQEGGGGQTDLQRPRAAADHDRGLGHHQSIHIEAHAIRQGGRTILTPLESSGVDQAAW
jgi:hypothetical protein